MNTEIKNRKQNRSTGSVKETAGSERAHASDPLKVLTAVLLSMSILFFSNFPSPFSLQACAESKGRTAYDIITDLVYSYKTEEVSAYGDITSLLTELKEVNAPLGNAWEKIMSYWSYINDDMTVNPGNLPDGLPQDSSLAIVVLGYMLNSDGTMQAELVHRCETALACAEKYPNAYIAVTGGGTALRHKEITEAGVMAEWLTAHGIDEGRIIIEDQSLTTGENAILTCGIITRQYPEIRHVAIVSSDYHVPLGCLLFQEQFLLTECATGEKAPSVISNAAYTTGPEIVRRIGEQASYVWMLSETANLY